MSSLKKTIGELKIGMFVSELDIPWIDSPYLLQGFVLKTQNDIDQLYDLCEFVYVESGHEVRGSIVPELATTQSFKSIRQTYYKDLSTWDYEYPKANIAIDELSDSIKDTFLDAASERSVDVSKIKESIAPMIDSVVRNPDACLWLAKLKQEDNYIYEHAISVSIWCVTLGRQLGLNKESLESLALGAVLLDLGKLQIDAAVLNHDRELNDEEFEIMKTHVDKSVELVTGFNQLDYKIIQMIQEHHERFDGSGYPKGLKDVGISLFGRIAAIADTYDAIISERSYQKAIAPAEAIKVLYSLKGITFQDELVEEFIQAVGIYPAGSLVELNSGEIAIVMAENRSRRLKPEVMVLFDQSREPLEHPTTIKLYDNEDNNLSLYIISSQDANAYNIDMKSINL